MSSKMVTVLVACAALAVAASACGGTADRNTNAAANHSANAANTNTPNANTATAYRRPLNANITREEYERDRDYWEREARQMGRRVGSGANDLWLWTKTRSALAYADDLRDVTINVDVENDVVTLTGTVGSDAQKSKAEQVARGIEGVRSVNNNLTVTR